MSAGLLPALVLVPLAGAVAAAATPAGRERLRARVSVVTGASVVVLVSVVCVAFAADGVLVIEVGGWEPPLGISLAADGLAVVMLALTALVAGAVLVFATGPAEVRGGPWFWPLALGLWAALNGVYLAADLFNAYVALELMGVCAVGLVALAGRDARPPALRYLFVAVLGSLFFLLAVGIVYAATGVLDMRRAAGLLGPGPLASVVLVLTAAGMAMKSALFPLHSWLPPAHAAAPAAVSPMLSALVVKASLVVLIRMWTVIGPDTPSPAVLLCVLGAAAVAWGCAQALREQTLKRIVSYSTVAQVGYLFLALGLTVQFAAAGDGRSSRTAWTGLILLVLAHGVAKAAMFLAAGTLIRARGTGDLRGLGGVLARRPLGVAAFALAGVSLAGLPPTIGFAGKWELLQAVIGSDQWWWVIVLVGGGLASVGYVGRVVRATFAGSDGSRPQDDRPVPRRMELTAFALAAGTVALTFASATVAVLTAASWPFEVNP